MATRAGFHKNASEGWPRIESETGDGQLTGAGRRKLAAAVLVLVALAGTTAQAAEPQITDAADDAYRFPDNPVAQPASKPPNPVLSNDAADVLSVTFTAAPPLAPQHDAGYTVSVTVAGEPHGTFNYLIGGYFGDDCYLIHFLNAGQTRPAIGYCGEGDKTRTVTEISGSAVVIKGNTISARFSFRRFTQPSALRKKFELGDLYTLTCPATGSSWGCNNNVLDSAFSESKFSV